MPKLAPFSQFLSDFHDLFFLFCSYFQAASIYCKSQAENQLEKIGLNPLQLDSAGIHPLWKGFGISWTFMTCHQMLQCFFKHFWWSSHCGRAPRWAIVKCPDMSWDIMRYHQLFQRGRGWTHIKFESRILACLKFESWISGPWGLNLESLTPLFKGPTYSYPWSLVVLV